MRLRLILDTKDILQAMYSNEFLDSIDDPKRIVERHFLKSVGYLFNYHEEPKRTDEEVHLLNEIMQAYECSIDRKYWENTYTGMNLSAMVEALMNEIHWKVRRTMYDALQNLTYEPMPNSVHWIGDDISFVVNIHDNNYTR